MNPDEPEQLELPLDPPARPVIEPEEDETIIEDEDDFEDDDEDEDDEDEDDPIIEEPKDSPDTR